MRIVIKYIELHGIVPDAEIEARKPTKICEPTY